MLTISVPASQGTYLSWVLCLLFFLGINRLEAQEGTIISCGTDQVHEHLMRSNSTYAREHDQFEERYQQGIRSYNARTSGRSAAVYTIPVVVHIIHDGATLGTDANPTDEMVRSIVEEASDRFRHSHSGAGSYTNPHYGSDTEIALCLAGQDPNGNYTSGVTRHYDPTNATGDYGVIAPALNAHAWDKSKYCNLYIVKSLTNASGVYMGGYDFTIYDSPAFWSGLIAHEVGHYFNLRHTFEPNQSCQNNDCLSDGDRVCDTPPKYESGSAGGSCVAPSNSCTTDDDDVSTNNPYRPTGFGGMGDQPDMLSNYMDYTGGCWDSFTAGQKARMRFNIDTYRVALKNNSAACNSSPPANDAGLTDVVLNQPDACTASFTPQVTLKNYGTAALTVVDIVVEVDGTPVITQPWTGSLGTGATTVVALSSPVVLSVGEHIIEFHTSMPNGNVDANIYNDAVYRTADYLGGTSCASFNSCSDFNGNTASGPGNNTIVDVSASFPISSLGVQICVTTEGDVSASVEVFDVYDESNALRGQTHTGADCTGPTEPFCFTISLAEYNAWKDDGSITITLSPVSTAINPTLCPTNEACATVNVPQGAPNCDPIVILNGTITTGVYQASNYIQANGNIYNANTVSLGATNYVELTADFEIESGAIFEIVTQGCN